MTPADYEPYCITAPVDPRLPGGGGYQVCGLYDVGPRSSARATKSVTRASNYGNGKSRVSDFFTVSVNTRLGAGIELGGSVDTGRTVEDNCFVVDSPQQLLNCRIVTPFKSQTQIKVYGSLPVAGRLRRERRLPERVGHPVRGELRRAQRRDCAVARPQPGGVRDAGGVHRHRHGAAHSPRRSSSPGAPCSTCG